MLQTILRQIRGEASDYANLALRAVTQKHLSFFVENAPNWLHKENEMLGLMAAQDPDVAAFLPSHYKSMVSLVKHRQDRTPGSLFWILVTSCLNLRQLQLAGYFNQSDVESPRPIELNPTVVKTKLTSDMKLIGHVLVEFLELMQYNTHGILESFGIAADDQVLFSNPLQDRVPKRQNRPFGAGVFPTLALLNHSCGHNIFKYNIGKKIVVLAGRNIRQGEEITENYFPHHYYMSQIDRQIWLQEHYNFRCECKACIEDWPTLGVLVDFRQWAFPLRAHESSKERSKAAEEEIKSVMDQVDQIRKSFLAQNSCLLISEAERLIIKFREGFKVLDRHIRYPSKEHTQASETFISLLTSIRGNRRELFSTSF
eukprot:TCALIF_00296-PA protein Name:"Similar to Smyd4 SET and MYND domain-containing protein 4 (Mus musculus)" AED:0.00 eAED:0.00 QI:140/1/1/1/0.75/0.6/5/342/369